MSTTHETSECWDEASTDGYLPHAISYYDGLTFRFPDPMPDFGFDFDSDNLCTSETSDIGPLYYDESDSFSDEDEDELKTLLPKPNRHNNSWRNSTFRMDASGGFMKHGVSDVFERAFNIIYREGYLKMDS